MAEKMKVGCSRPVFTNQVDEETIESKIEEKKGEQIMIKVGKPAPLFTAPAYHKGDFTSVNLEDYRGKWVLLCFYPGDFTFV